MNGSEFDKSGSAWISKGFETLVAGSDDDRKFDVLIVGSGYGAAIAADTLTRFTKTNGQPINVGVLERGKEYLPGEFPANSTEVPAHVRFHRNDEGLFDFRLSPDVGVLVANGLGGGSLINAGVMKRPLDKIFESGWPGDYQNAASMHDYFDRAELLLGAATLSGGQKVPNQIEKDLDGNPLKKLIALKNLTGGENFEVAPVTVANADGPNSAHVQLSNCTRCGDCATGCNHNAKDSLDTNLLVNAFRRGARLYTGATVLRIKPDDDSGGWLVYTAFTDKKLRKLHKMHLPDDQANQGPVKLSATNVILAAGTLGSTEILKRSQAGGLALSAMLGRKCSANGDTVIAHYDTDSTVNAVGNETLKPINRKVGPTITGILDLREHQNDDLKGLLIEEMATPASLRRVFGELYASVNLLRRLGDCDRSWHETGFPNDDLYELKDGQIDQSALYAVMGDDGASGEIEVTGSLTDNENDNVARMCWPDVGEHPLFDQQVRALRKLTEGKKGHVLPNPLWQVLPETVALLADMERGPIVTVHPLGGCAMADAPEKGVVDQKGMVFDPGDAGATHDGLAVLDGSIIPVALGVNPALTIAAVALRSSLQLADEWGYVPGPHVWKPENGSGGSPQAEAVSEFFGGAVNQPAQVRPRLRQAETEEAFNPEATMVRLTERMSGSVWLRGGSGLLCKKWIVELTLRFNEKSLRALTHPSSNDSSNASTFHVHIGGEDPSTRSKLRIFDPENEEFKEADKKRSLLASRELEEILDQVATFKTDIQSGTLLIFERQKSWFVWRILRSGFAWVLNHGLRDIWQALSSSDTASPSRSPLAWIKSLLALATRAGEVRKFKYSLQLGEPVPSEIAGNAGDGRTVQGEKRFTYALCSNPWNQLMQMRVTRFPGLIPWLRRCWLNLDLAYLARIRIPLFEITRENDGVTALAELASFVSYFARMLLGIHVLSFRAPDEPTDARLPNRLPGRLNGIPEYPEIYSLPLGDERPYYSELPENDPAAKIPVRVRLARYAKRDSNLPPIVMMHGYSASGTTFAHNAVKDNFVKYFHNRGRDVWVADFRTSCGMPTATEPWSFEQVAYRDIPEIIEFVCGHTDYRDGEGKPKVDVIAHCMGAAMFSMAMLHSQHDELGFPSEAARKELPNRVRRVAFTQVSPLPVMSPANIFRGYVVSFFRELLPDRYQFNPGPHGTLMDKVLDRLLTTVPYPREEFRVENPLLPWRRTPWTRTRHRMDILYGRAFNARNIDRKVLNHIDDFFGPLSIDTVTQTIAFARYGVITNVEGRNTFVSRENLKDRWQDAPLLLVNARNNGLVDAATAYRTKPVFKDAGRGFVKKFVDGGHQDCLIGEQPRADTLDAIAEYLDNSTQTSPSTASENFVVYTPWIGPVRTFEPNAPVDPNAPDDPDAPVDPDDPDAPVDPCKAFVGQETFRVGSHPTHDYTRGVLLLRVKVEGGLVLRPGGQPFLDDQITRDYLVAHAYFANDEENMLRNDNWGKFRVPPVEAPFVPPDGKGNAWLVLLTYADSSVLNAARGYFRALAVGGVPSMVQLEIDKNNNWEFPTDLLHIQIRDPIEIYSASNVDNRVFDLELMRKMIEPVVILLSKQRPTMESEDVLQMGGQSLLIQDSNQGSSIQNVLSPAIGDSLVDRLTDERFDLRDGIMPDIEEAQEECSFLLTSCQYPAGFFDGPLAYDAYRETLRRLDTAGDGQNGNGNASIVPRFGVFAGDQIYADASAGLFDPSVKRGRFELPYHKWLRYPHVRGLLRRVRSFMLLDDHEINDNWEHILNDPANDQLLKDGTAGYKRFQRGICEEFPYEFSLDGCQFIMLNSRGGREGNARDARKIQQANIIPSPRLDAITDKLGDRKSSGNHPLVFIVTPSMLLPRHRHAAQWNATPTSLRSDGWDGYPLSLFGLLQALVDEEARNVVFLSGDEHLPCLAHIEIERAADGRKAVVHSIHTSAAFAPYAFANSSQVRHLETETIFFNVDRGAETVSYASNAVASTTINQNLYAYRCRVTTDYPAAKNCMTYLRATKLNSASWSLRVEFGDHVETILDVNV